MKVKSTFLAISILGAFSVHAQFRKYSNEFLNIGAGARGMGMGGAQVASVSDATAGYWNPAALTAVQDHPSVSLMHAEYFAGIGKYDFGSIAIPTKDNRRTLGFTVLRFAVDDIPNTLYLVQPDGSLNYNSITSFSSADYAFLFSYAQKINTNNEDNHLSIGGNAKVIYRKVGTFATAYGFGFDLALQYITPKWSFGAVLRDASTTFNAWSFTFTDREQQALYLTNNNIPVKSTELTAPRLSLGGSHHFSLGKKSSLSAELAMDVTFDGKRNTVISSDPVSVDPRLGLELNISNTFFLRGGVYNFQQGLKDGDTTNQQKVWIYQPCIGAGFKFGNVAIDYAYNNLANQSSPLYTNVISLRVDIVKKKEH
jgi:hypothetical protein